ncbi:MAG: hypothetical protein AB7I30_08690, partial [Isosphaeraceae bacterium]
MSTPAPRPRKPRIGSVARDHRRRRAVDLGRLESLEPRTLMAVMTVTTNVDTIDPSDNALSLREAIEVSNGTRPIASLSAFEQLLVSGSLSAPAPNTIQFASPNLRLISPVNAVGDLPATGRNQIIVADVQGSLHFRIFDASGQLLFDAGETSPSLFGKASIIADLKLLLTGLWAKSPLTQDEVNSVIKRVLAIDDHRPPMNVVVTSPLPALTSPVEIHGGGQSNPVDQPDVNLGVPYVRIDGRTLGLAQPGLLANGLSIQAANCRIIHMIVTGFLGSGVEITGAGSQGNSLFGNFIGTLPDPINGRNFAGGAALRNGVGLSITSSNNRIGGNTPGLPNVIANNGVGVRIDKPFGTGNLLQGNFILDNVAQGVYVSSSNNTIGEALTGGGNVISGNGAQGVLITGGADVQGNNLLGNLIGTDIGVVGSNPPKGLWARANGLEGVLIRDSPKNIVGGNTAAARNVIGGNLGDGVVITGAESAGNRVHGNWIGFNIVNGLVSLGLANHNGVVIDAPGNDVGGSNDGEGNTISLNRSHGILISGNLSSGTRVLGNTIGLNPDKGSDFGNTLDGVHVVDAKNTLIGGTTLGARNYISGNNHGIVLSGVNTTGSRIQGNFIGTAGDGRTDLGNAVNGVFIVNSPLNTVGGTETGAGNVISGNDRGVEIRGAGSQDNEI